jgi:hypothetical protein
VSGKRAQPTSIEAQYKALQAAAGAHQVNALAEFTKNMLISTNC